MKFIYRTIAILVGTISLGLAGSVIMWGMAFILSNGGRSHPINSEITLTNWLLSLLLTAAGYYLVKESNIDVY